MVHARALLFLRKRSYLAGRERKGLRPGRRNLRAPPGQAGLRAGFTPWGRLDGVGLTDVWGKLALRVRSDRAREASVAAGLA